MGIGRTRYYYGKSRSEIHVSFNSLNGEYMSLPNDYSRRASLSRSQIKILTVHSMSISCCPDTTEIKVIGHGKTCTNENLTSSFLGSSDSFRIMPMTCNNLN